MNRTTLVIAAPSLPLLLVALAAAACADDVGETSGGGGGSEAEGTTTGSTTSASSSGTGSATCDPGSALATVAVDAVVPVATGIEVAQGDSVVFRATGTWCWGAGDPEACPDADGTPGRPLPDELPVTVEGAPFGALGGSVGTSLFAIGSCATVIMPEDGELILFMSDRIGFFADNSGSIDVAIERAP